MMKNRLNNDFRAFLNAGRTDIRAIFRLRPYRVSIYSDRVPECQPKQRVCRRPLSWLLLETPRPPVPPAVREAKVEPEVLQTV
jgi:hypothetical protein